LSAVISKALVSSACSALELVFDNAADPTGDGPVVSSGAGADFGEQVFGEPDRHRCAQPGTTAPGWPKRFLVLGSCVAVVFLAGCHGFSQRSSR
jgi:hypothetical protein